MTKREKARELINADNRKTPNAAWAVGQRMCSAMRAVNGCASSMIPTVRSCSTKTSGSNSIACRNEVFVAARFAFVGVLLFSHGG